MVMRIIIEETSNTENKQRTQVECEKDDVELDVAFSLLLRALYAYGYRQDHVIGYIHNVLAQQQEAPPEQQPDSKQQSSVLPKEPQ